MAESTGSGARKRPAARAASPAKRPVKKAPAAKRAGPGAATPAPVAATIPAIAATPPRRPLPPRRSRQQQRSRWCSALSGLLVVLALVLMLSLGAQERGGPAHDYTSIGSGIPATLYLPVKADEDGNLPPAPPKGHRPPVVVIAHGYSADQASMSGLARSLAKLGYATITFDFRGHGSNTHAFEGDLDRDISSVVTWAQQSPYVDGTRLALLGHSMGANAVLDFATKDARPKAVIPLSGGFVVNDAVTPAHTLLLDASGDPSEIRDRQPELRDDLEARHADVTQKEISGVNHITILRSSDTVKAVVAFLDPILHPDRPDGVEVGLHDGRMKTAVLYLLVAMGLMAVVGSLAGRLVPEGPGDPAGAPVWTGFVLLGGALLLTIPVLAVAPIDPLPIGAPQPMIVHFALAGAVLWGCRTLARRGKLSGPVRDWFDDRPWLPLRQVGGAGLAATGAVIVLLLPLADVFHRMVPTPARSVYWVVTSLLALPFFSAFEGLLRRGRPGRAAGWGVLGRVLLLVVLYIGLAAHALPGVIALVAPLLVLQFIILEVVAAGAYAKARNAALVAVIDAVFLGWVAVVVTPVG
jgi:dienelactone hydrolase